MAGEFVDVRGYPVYYFGGLLFVGDCYAGPVWTVLGEAEGGEDEDEDGGQERVDGEGLHW